MIATITFVSRTIVYPYSSQAKHLSMTVPFAVSKCLAFGVNIVVSGQWKINLIQYCHPKLSIHIQLSAHPCSNNNLTISAYPQKAAIQSGANPSDDCSLTSTFSVLFSNFSTACGREHVTNTQTEISLDATTKELHFE